MTLKRQTIESQLNIPSDGLILVDKPSGMRTTELLNKVKSLLSLNKAGHGGTLDPFAEGLIIILFGKATKLMDYIGDEKEYIGTMKLGVITDTDDPDGEILEENKVPELKKEKVEETLSGFEGKFTQIVPLYSAVKREGERLYNKARRGEKVDKLPGREVVVEEIELLDFSPPLIKFRCLAHRGTYMRSLARDIGNVLGCGAHLCKLSRVSIGPYKLEDSATLSDIKEGDFKVIEFRKALPHLKAITLREDGIWDFVHGGKVRGFYPKGLYQVRDNRGNLLGIGKGETYAVQPVKVFYNK
jgi:tRNA pseudouridine55 synthase